MQLPRIPLLILAFAIGGYSASGDTEMKQENTQSAEQNKALVRQVLKLIDERNLDEAFELYALDYIYHGPGGQELRGRDGIRGLWEVFLVGLPDLHSTIEDMVSEGDKLVLRWRIKGTHTGEFLGVAPTNAEINLGITEIFRIYKK